MVSPATSPTPAEAATSVTSESTSALTPSRPAV